MVFLILKSDLYSSRYDYLNDNYSNCYNGRIQVSIGPISKLLGFSDSEAHFTSIDQL